MRELQNLGFTKVYALKGGYVSWIKAGLPTQHKAFAQSGCVSCHQKVTPTIVGQWRQSAHSNKLNAVSCSVCHGDEHSSMQDIDRADPVSEKVCRTCHENEYLQFSRGKHATAWDTMQAMPDFHWSDSRSQANGSCSDCHAIGFKPDSEIARLRDTDHPTGSTSCNNCHRGHAYSLQEARQPAACKPCHQGASTQQWSAYAGSEHGQQFMSQTRAESRETAESPSCQTCHFPQGRHGVRTAWGALGLRLPWPDDPEWALARRKIMQAIGFFNAQGRPTTLYTQIPKYGYMTYSDKRWAWRRSMMQGTCSTCHSMQWSHRKLKDGDTTIRRTDILLAQGLDLVTHMGRQGMLGKPLKSDFLPDIGRYDPAFSQAERILYRMFHVQRKQAWQGRFHGNEKMAEEGLARMQASLDKLRQLSQRP